MGLLKLRDHGAEGGAPTAGQCQPGAGALEGAIRRYHAGLMSFLRWKLGSDQDAQDAAQDTYARLMRYEGAGQEEIPKALVMQVATHVVIDRRRYQSSRQAEQHLALHDDIVVESTEALPEQRAADAQELAAVKRAVLRLPPRWRDAFVLSRVQGMSNQQIASELGITTKAVERLITKALHQLRARVGRPGP